MTERKPFTQVAGLVFLAIAVAHLLRLVQGWQVTIADSAVPLWVSWIALAISGLFAVMLLRESRR